MTDSDFSDREYLTANPTRRYRIVHRSPPNSAGMVYADVTSFADDRHGWSRQRIITRAELPDTDAAALLALEKRNTVTVGQVNR